MDTSSRCHGPTTPGPMVFSAPSVSLSSPWFQPVKPEPPEPVWVKHLLTSRWLPWCSVGRLPDGETELVVSVTDRLTRVAVRGLFIEAGV